MKMAHIQMLRAVGVILLSLIVIRARLFESWLVLTERVAMGLTVNRQMAKKCNISPSIAK